MRIPGFRGIKPGLVIRRSILDFINDDMLTYASSLAYSVLFALFPFVIFLLALLSVLQVPDFFDWLLEQARYLVPGQAFEAVATVINDIRREERGDLLSFGILLAIWSASVGVRATMNALNVAYDVEETRPAWKRYVLSIVYTIGLAATLIVAVGLMLTGPQIVIGLADQIGLGQLVVGVWVWLRWPIAVLLLMVSVALVYYLAPNIKQRFRLITPGSVVAVVIWIAASFAFAAYVANYANYATTYGSFGAVIVLLLYLYMSAAALLFGAEINGVIERAVNRQPATDQAAMPSEAMQHPKHKNLSVEVEKH